MSSPLQIANLGLAPGVLAHGFIAPAQFSAAANAARRPVQLHARPALKRDASRRHGGLNCSIGRHPGRTTPPTQSAQASRPGHHRVAVHAAGPPYRLARGTW
jgi:hypothetical protein